MSDLQIVLVVLGVLIIVGVIIYNWLQEKKLRNNITEEFIVPQKDVLVEEFHIDTEAYIDKEFADDPHRIEILDKLNDADHEASTVPTPPFPDDAEKIEATLPQEAEQQWAEVPETILQSPPVETENTASKEVAQVTDTTTNSNEIEKSDISLAHLPDDVHPQIDLTAFLYASRNISTEELVLLSDTIEKDMGVAMMMVYKSDEEGVWFAANDSGGPKNFKQVACSIQLADRAGPIAKHTLNKFQFSVENMGLELSAHVEWQSNSKDAYAQATSLDEFCMEVDQLVNVHLIQDSASVHGTKFKGLAEANGMRLDEDGKYHYPANALDAPQFVLINADHQPFTVENLRNNVVKGASFQIEIPKVVNCEQTFIQMIDIAKKMAAGMNARIVDDNEKLLSEAQIKKIQQQLKVIHAKMVARGIMPGSKSTLRLFN